MAYSCHDSTVTDKAISVGILGVGVYLPPEVRRNDAWSADVVARWMEMRRAAPPPPPPPDATEGARRVLDALAEQGRDPFLSAVERRVMPAGMSVHEMEERAARAALAEADVEPGEIDLLLTQTSIPEYLLANPACILHERLGLPRACFAMHTDVSSSAFLMQLTVAEAMIRAGRARRALLVQSCIPSRLVELDAPIAPLFGDLATAVVVGPVAAERGIEAAACYADGRNPKTLVVSVPGGAWYEDGRAVLHVADARQNHAVFLESVDTFRRSLGAVLDASGHAASDVDFLCVHQGAPWMRAIVQDYAGMTRARSVETFTKVGYVFACTLPVALASAQEQGLLTAGDLVALVAGGPGATYGAMIIRWGRE